MSISSDKDGGGDLCVSSEWGLASITRFGILPFYFCLSFRCKGSLQL